jgi:predicted NAD/FAD-dependent oxidoreductase
MSAPILVGANLAVLVAATELVRRGRRVTLATDGRTPGGHFAGLTLADHRFDIGMVLLEQHVPAAPATALGSYDPHRRNDWTRFGHLAAAWLTQQVELVRTPTPECLLAGTVWPDYLIANRLEALAHRSLPHPEPLSRDDPRHAAHKSEAGPYDTMTYAEAADRHHGGALHGQCIEPFVRKVTGAASGALLARHHRAAWAPLFYPDTVGDALAGRPCGLPEYPFWTTAEGHAGALTRRLVAALDASPLATVVTTPVAALRRAGAGWTLACHGSPALCTDRLALGVPADRGHALLGIPAPGVPPAASVTLLFALVQADAIGRQHGCLLVVDEDHATYRVSNQDWLAGRSPRWHRVTVEANPDLLARLHPGVEPVLAMSRELGHFLQVRGDDAIQPLRVVTAQHALLLPTPGGVAAAGAGHAALREAAPGIPLTGALLGYGVASMNDQIVQGLSLAEEFA